MANRYWVGGTASWDGTAGTKWAETSGGAGGLSVPTAADDVFFDAASTGTVTIASGQGGAKSINCTGFTGTLAGTAAIPIAGSITLAAGMTFTYSGSITFTGTGTLTSAGKTFNGGITINGSGITTTLGDALTMGNSSSITVTTGTFTTNNYNITGGQLNSTGSSVRAINLGSSTVTLRFNTPVNFTTTANLTFNAGTSTIIVDSSANTFNGGTRAQTGVTFYNVIFNQGNAGSGVLINGKNTFNDLTLKGNATSTGTYRYVFQDDQTINGTFSTGDTGPVRRVFVTTTSNLSATALTYTLTLNGAVSLSDIDFELVNIKGTAAPISGTRIGNRRYTSGITFSTPKTVYLVGNTNGWGGNDGANWAATSGGTGAGENFPLPQDTAVIDNSSPSSISLSNGPDSFGTLNSSARTTAMSISFSQNYYVYGNIITGSGITYSNNRTLFFASGGTQTILSAGKSLNQSITIVSIGGRVELLDALNCGTSGTVSVFIGTFDTRGYNLTCPNISSQTNIPRTILLGTSTVTLSGTIDFHTSTNLTFDGSLSTITSSATTFSINVGSTAGPGLTFGNITSTSTASTGGIIINGATNTFNNITTATSSTNGFRYIQLNSNQIINGTLTCAGASETRRVRVLSNITGIQRTITVASLVADNCDFRDIIIAGAAAGAAPSGAGDAGGNSGITFPAPKTVYWNLAGSNNWDAVGWAATSGGTPAVANFPLAQDTCVFDNAGSAGTVSFNYAHLIGTLNAGSRTNAITFSHAGQSPQFHGNLTLGTGVTITDAAGTYTFFGRGTQTITSNGVVIGANITISKPTGTVELADALSLGTRDFTLMIGGFDAKTYNVTVGKFFSSVSNNRTLKMGSGTWTLTASSLLWEINASSLDYHRGTANIVLSDTSTSSRIFSGGALSYNKLTIGGATGTSTTTIQSASYFEELASTKTVAHTITLANGIVFGKWSVTGSAGNVVTITGGSLEIYGPAVTGIDYLAMGSVGFNGLSPGEFYAGANSTGTASAPVFRTAAPTARTLYWVGGTGNWSDTSKWSLSSGGSGGQAIPTSLDNVVFDSSSNATAYTVTIDTTARCNNFNMSGPASGNVTIAGTSALISHGGITFAATGITRSFTGTIILSGSGSGKTITTNGLALSSNIFVRGMGAQWALGSALTTTNRSIQVAAGDLDFATYNSSFSDFSHAVTMPGTINFGSGTMTLSISQNSTALGFGSTAIHSNYVTIIPGTSQINITSSGSPIILGNGKTFYNVSFVGESHTLTTISGSNTFNNLSFDGRSTVGISRIALAADQTISGTLTVTASTSAITRRFFLSNTDGVQRTLTCNAVSSLSDVDFRDIRIAGAAVSGGNITGTRLGDCTGNSGITFPAPKTVYWNLAAGGSWTSTAWATSSGGGVDVNNFPLAQDIAIVESSSPNSGASININSSQTFNIGKIDLSGRTSNTLSFIYSSGSVFLYGDFINGTGVTISGSGSFVFSGSTNTFLTSAGKTFTQIFIIRKPGGSLSLQDALTLDQNTIVLQIESGTFDAVSYNVTLSAAASSFNSSNSNVRTIGIGSGTWTLAGSGSTVWTTATSANATVTGTGTIKFTSASSKTFQGGGINCSTVTIDQAGAGSLSFTSSGSIFANITNSYSATGATTINFLSQSQTVGNFTAKGEAGRILTVRGTDAGNAGTLFFSGNGYATSATTDYLQIIGMRVYPAKDTWYAGNNSTSEGTLGWILSELPPAPPPGVGGFFLII